MNKAKLISSKGLESYTELSEIDTQETWQNSLSNAITEPAQLLERLDLNRQSLEAEALLAAKHFRVFATESYLKRIETGNWDDPLLKQILPRGAEVLNDPNYSIDPLGEQEASPLPGLLHKYHGRVLLITNAQCAINCRFCFRKNYPYSGNHLSSRNRNELLDYLQRNTDVSEVILSGGDPLLLNDNSVAELLQLLSGIRHIQRLRIHSRIPIVLPERITPRLLKTFSQSRLKVIMVIHCNHPQEIDQEVSTALGSLKSICFSLLNQSVLLKGVNDDPESLIELQYALFENGVQSYYLHLLDKVKGTAHFDLPLKTAQGLYQVMSEQLPGYMLPKLVREVAGKAHKVQIGQIQAD